MATAAGYLYTVGRNRARRQFNRRPSLPAPEAAEQEADRCVVPGLPHAPSQLTTRQRTAVILVHGCGWTLEQAAWVLGTGRSTVRKHADRGLARLRGALGVPDAG